MTILEITSYGSLPQGLSEEEFFQGFSILRNKELMRIFKDLDLVEQLGSGIPRILESYDKDCFKFSENFLRVVLPSSKIISILSTEQDTEQVTKQVLCLISVMKEGKYSRNELMEAVNIKYRPTFLYN